MESQQYAYLLLLLAYCLYVKVFLDKVTTSRDHPSAQCSIAYLEMAPTHLVSAYDRIGMFPKPQGSSYKLGRIPKVASRVTRCVAQEPG